MQGCWETPACPNSTSPKAARQGPGGGAGVTGAGAAGGEIRGEVGVVGCGGVMVGSRWGRESVSENPSQAPGRKTPAPLCPARGLLLARLGL